MELKNNIINFFKSGIKTENKKMLGVEIEHFVVDRNEEAVSYYGPCGVKTILKKLMKFYPDVTSIFDEDIIGFRTREFTITLEPAAQVEISINPYEKISKIKKIYKTFLNNINFILNDFGYKLSFLSCQKKSKIEDIKIIPKTRYKLMEKYFKKIKTNGIEMMKGTCSVQVSIDYFSEKDFRKKIQVAYFLTPIFKLISNNSNCFQGKIFKNFLKRTEIYNSTDNSRCGIPPNIFSKNYGFKDYADYLCNVPLMFYPKDNILYETDKTFQEIFKDKRISENEIWHLLSIVFPDVRVKKYLEIRAADLMPYECIFGYCTLIKSIFYYENILNMFYNTIKNYGINEEKVDNIQNDIMKNGWNSKSYGGIKKFAEKVIKLSRENATDNEDKYLAHLLHIIEKDGLLNTYF